MPDDTLELQASTTPLHPQGPHQMKPLTRLEKYHAIQDEKQGWSVVDMDTELAYCMKGVPMVSLEEDTAAALAKMLNDISTENRTVH